ncbi:MAG TPA: hypothetical protein VK658_01025 [Chryseolinea sp.]|nr:hypothetical protein [Chryseolinea sp.]
MLAVVPVVLVINSSNGQVAIDSISSKTIPLRAVVALDSIKASWLSEYESLNAECDSVISNSAQKLNVVRQNIATLNAAFDSSKFAQRIDSILRWKDEKLKRLTKKSDSIQQAVKSKLDRLPLPPELRAKADQVVNDVNRLSARLNQSLQSGIRGATLKLAPDVSQSLQSITDVGSGVMDLVKEGDPTNLSDIGMNGLAKLEQVKGIERVTHATEGGSEGLSTAAQEQLSSTSLLNGVQEQISKGSQLNSMLSRAGDEEAVKQQLLQQAQEQAMDHFKDHADKLSKAMAAIGKHKARIPSVTSLNDIPRRTPNEMKGKPFIERLVPGVAFQLLKKDKLVSVDFNFYAGYRFTKRLTAGAGWNERVGFNTKTLALAPGDVRIYGPRMFSSYKLSRGFEPRVEVEMMNTFIPLYIRNPHIDPGSRRWVWGAFVGMAKTYNITKRLRGTATIMLRLFDPNRTSPYPDVINARFGVELPIKKRDRQKAP